MGLERSVTSDQLARLASSAAAIDDLGSALGGLLVVDPGGSPIDVPPLLPVVVVAVGDRDRPAATGADLSVASEELDRVRATVGANPQAATALAVLLRGATDRSVVEALQVESAVYGALQGGAEFAAWRAAHPGRERGPSSTEPVVVRRDGRHLDVVLARPEVRNALDAGLRDALAEALVVALEDPSLQVELSGAGPVFSSGGDLDEFGTRPDPATAHLVRLARSPAWLLHQLADRTHARVHGPCRGSGVELAAFARRVTAHPDTTFGLPEVAMGLIPGAGGTASLPRRIGRERTAWLALTGSVIDATTALAWGLVDEVGEGA